VEEEEVDFEEAIEVEEAASVVVVALEEEMNQLDLQKQLKVKP
jgi:hypothetical protein